MSFFLAWYGGPQCLPCGDIEGWLPAIYASTIAVVIVAPVAYATVKTGLVQALLRYYKIGKTKAITLVQICQANISLVKLH